MSVINHYDSDILYIPITYQYMFTKSLTLSIATNK